jgi:hypothetical protein
MPQTFKTSITIESNLNGTFSGVNDIYLNSQGNISIAGTTPDNNDQLEAVMFACSTASKAQLGEMVLQTNLGIPNFQLIWVGVPNIPQWRAALISTFRRIPGVVDVLTLNTAYMKNILSYTAIILTLYGQGNING